MEDASKWPFSEAKAIEITQSFILDQTNHDKMILQHGLRNKYFTVPLIKGISRLLTIKVFAPPRYRRQ